MEDGGRKIEQMMQSRYMYVSRRFLELERQKDVFPVKPFANHSHQRSRLHKHQRAEVVELER